MNISIDPSINKSINQSINQSIERYGQAKPLSITLCVKIYVKLYIIFFHLCVNSLLLQRQTCVLTYSLCSFDSMSICYPSKSICASHLRSFQHLRQTYVLSTACHDFPFNFTSRFVPSTFTFSLCLLS